MLMRPMTPRRFATLGVQSRMIARDFSDMVCGGMLHAESPECTPACSMCSMMPQITTLPSASQRASTSSSVAFVEVLVDEHRLFRVDLHGGGDVTLQVGIGGDDLHRASTEHERGAHHDGVPDVVRSDQRLSLGASDAAGGLGEFRAPRESPATSRDPPPRRCCQGGCLGCGSCRCRRRRGWGHP